MRLTADVWLQQAEQWTNPLQEREIDLSNLGIPAIENAAVTLDALDCWNLSHNQLERLDNFPKLHRLSNLLCANNRIASFDVKNLSTNIPNVTSLSLSYNRVATWKELVHLCQSFPKLIFLDLTGNPITSTFCCCC